MCQGFPSLTETGRNVKVWTGKTGRKREVEFVLPKNVEFVHFSLAHFLGEKGH